MLMCEAVKRKSQTKEIGGYLMRKRKKDMEHMCGSSIESRSGTICRPALGQLQLFLLGMAGVSRAVAVQPLK